MMSAPMAASSIFSDASSVSDQVGVVAPSRSPSSMLSEQQLLQSSLPVSAASAQVASWSPDDPLEAKKRRIDDRIDNLTDFILEEAWSRRTHSSDVTSVESRTAASPNSISDGDAISIVQHSMRRLALVQNALIDASRAIQIENVKNNLSSTSTSVNSTAAFSHVPGFLVPATLSPQLFHGVSMAHKLLPPAWAAFFFRHMATLNLAHDTVTGIAALVAVLVLFDVVPIECTWITFLFHMLLEAPYLFLLLNIDLAKRLLYQFDVLYLCFNWCVINFFCLPDLFGWDLRTIATFANGPTAILNLLADASEGEITRKHHRGRTMAMAPTLIFYIVMIRLSLFHNVVPRSIDLKWLEIRTDSLFVTCTSNIIVFSLRFAYNAWRKPQSALMLTMDIERSDLGRTASVQQWAQKLKENKIERRGQ